MQSIKNFRILLTTIMIISAGMVACDDDEKSVEDPVYEFISFKENPSISLNEHENSENPYPVVVQLWAFKPYNEDIDITLDIVGTNAAEGVDFTTTPGNTLKIKAGSLVSDTLFIQTIDNDQGTSENRSFEIKIQSVSKSDIKIGLGIESPENASVVVSILDDECSNPITIFNGELVNTLDWGGGDVQKPATGTVTNEEFTVSGDLIDYSPLSATVTITLTPESTGATKGKATFGEQEAGTDSEGYDYKFIEVGEGTFDTCSGIVSIQYDIYYWDGGWVYWYTVSNKFSVP